MQIIMNLVALLRSNFIIFFQLVLLLTTAAAIQAQILTPSITSQDSNIYRTLGNLGQVSHHSKTIDTPYSSVSKSDVRVSNPGINTLGGLGLAQGLSPYGVAPIGLSHGISPLGLSHGISPLGLSHGISPLGLSHGISPIGLTHAGIHSPLAPRLALPGTLARPVGVAPGLLGVAYSVAPAVSHMSYTNGLGLSYAW
jgi:hypothetical protein